jgi:hypothetical protein
MGAVHCCFSREKNRRPEAPRGNRQLTTEAHTRLPNDVVQNVVEYLDTVQAMSQSRLVTVGWRTATAYAVGFLNGRCWDTFTNERDAAS